MHMQSITFVLWVYCKCMNVVGGAYTLCTHCFGGAVL